MGVNKSLLRAPGSCPCLCIGFPVSADSNRVALLDVHTQASHTRCILVGCLKINPVELGRTSTLERQSRNQHLPVFFRIRTVVSVFLPVSIFARSLPDGLLLETSALTLANPRAGLSHWIIATNAASRRIPSLVAFSSIVHFARDRAVDLATWILG